MNVPADEEIKKGLDFILTHFIASGFPRTVSTKTTDGRQIQVNNRAEALARFKQASYLDCRINAYSSHDIKGDPNFIFIDIDSIEKQLLDKMLNGKFQSVGAYPTVLFTGNGFHIYQPIDSICIDDVDTLRDYDHGHEQPSRQFLKFAEMYLSGNKSDPYHNPSFRSCMVRIPNSINSKNGRKVKIIQQWDGDRPEIRLLLGSFYAWLLTEQKKREDRAAPIARQINNSNNAEIKWIENKLLQTALNDYRKTIINLVLAPYLANERKLSFEQCRKIIERWLDMCRAERELDFNTKTFINTALIRTRKSGYKPMSLNKLKLKNRTVYRRLGIRR